MRTKIPSRAALSTLAALLLAGCAATSSQNSDPRFGGYHRAGSRGDLTPLITERRLPALPPPEITKHKSERRDYPDRNYRYLIPERYDTTGGNQFNWNVNYNLYGPQARRGWETRLWYRHMRSWPDMPWYTSGWSYYDPWYDYYPYYGYWDWGRWYDPWYGYYDPWYGYYDPWYGYYDPWYGYYDPWYSPYDPWTYSYHRGGYYWRRYRYYDPYWYYNSPGSRPDDAPRESTVQRARDRKDRPSAVTIGDDAPGSGMTGTAGGGSDYSSGMVSRPARSTTASRDSGDRSAGSSGKSTASSAGSRTRDRSSAPSIDRGRSSPRSRSGNAHSARSARSSSRSSSSSSSTQTSRSRRRKP